MLEPASVVLLKPLAEVPVGPASEARLGEEPPSVLLVAAAAEVCWAAAAGMCSLLRLYW